jgi:NTP pyrophosphatase (non-canonical NTP hydrolase)
MDIKQAQDKIKEFDKAREWQDSWNIKDLLLNITEEGGEMWNLIKWVDEQKQKEIVNNEKEKVSDYIGDTLFLLLKIANQTGIDAGKALQETLDEYEKRMPADAIKKIGHANKKAGGIDNKKISQRHKYRK